jgi:hypothetical protein
VSRIVLFALDELRARYGGRLPSGADPRHHTGPFQAFREALLREAARGTGSMRLSMWWEGTYNGYSLAVAFEPAEALPDLAGLEAVCPIEGERMGEPRPDAVPMAEVTGGRAAVARDAAGAAHEAPFGAATGHFGAPGMKRVS